MPLLGVCLGHAVHADHALIREVAVLVWKIVAQINGRRQAGIVETTNILLQLPFVSLLSGSPSGATTHFLQLGAHAG